MHHPAKNPRGFTLIELLIVVAIIGIIAAISIPSLLRARVSANEAGTVGDIRTVMSSEAAYHSANDGHFGILTCLATPQNAACIPGYDPLAPTFLDVNIAQADPGPHSKSGYRRTVNYAPAPPPPAQAGDTDSYCYQARPVTLNRTGVRSFGGDLSGVVAGANGGIDCCVLGLLVAACPAVN